MKRFHFDISDKSWEKDDEICNIEAPNLNVTIMKLAMEHDLSDANAIYIGRKDEDEDKE